jgi:sulfite reductase (ferredoxin)
LRFSLSKTLLRNIKEENLPLPRISQIRFCYLGYDTINDITACPGTDTCNLGIASSTGIAEE